MFGVEKSKTLQTCEKRVNILEVEGMILLATPSCDLWTAQPHSQLALQL